MFYKKDLVYLLSGSASLLAVACNLQAARRFFGGAHGSELCYALTATTRRAMWGGFAAALAAAEWVERKDPHLAPHIHHVGLMLMSLIAVYCAEETEADRRTTQYGRVMLTSEVLAVAVAMYRVARNHGFPGRSRAAVLAAFVLALAYRAALTVPAWQAVLRELAGRDLLGPARGFQDHIRGHRLVAHLTGACLCIYDLHSWRWAARQLLKSQRPRSKPV